jgi:single-strand DNA-binding protein
MADYNKIILVGNLTRDPEHRQLPSGQNMCKLGLAVNRQFKNRQTGDTISEVCFVDIDVWGAQADSCHRYLQKGRRVLIEGRLKLDSWDDQQTGQKRSKHSVVAERVVFLSTADQAMTQQEEGLQAGTSAAKLDDELDPEISKKIEEVKKRVSKKKDKQAGASQEGNAAFKDTPPFQDDLPF